MEASIDKKNKFSIGDLVRFDITRALGIVVDIKTSTAFTPPEEVQDVRVRWFDGETFWCLEYTLKLISSCNRY